MEKDHLHKETSKENSTEPADPSEVDHNARRAVRLSLNVDRLPKVFVECGCGDCPEVVDPLYEGESGIRADFWAKDQCDNPRSMTVERARKAYVVYERASRQSDQRTSKYERHKHEVYPRILNADRHFREHYDGLTTVMLTLREVPTDQDDRWMPPLQLDRMLNNTTATKSVRKALNYHLKRKAGLRFEYIRVVAPTRSAATPHAHWYLWIEDPDNIINVEQIKPALEKHLKYCFGAYGKDHPTDSEGESEAITIRHDPPLVDEDSARGDDLRHTLGAQYLASQLAHLPLGDKFDPEKDDPKDTLLEGGAIAWASSKDWFGASRGVPKLDD